MHRQQVPAGQGPGQEQWKQSAGHCFRLLPPLEIPPPSLPLQTTVALEMSKLTALNALIAAAKVDPKLPEPDRQGTIEGLNKLLAIVSASQLGPDADVSEFSLQVPARVQLEPGMSGWTIKEASLRPRNQTMPYRSLVSCRGGCGARFVAGLSSSSSSSGGGGGGSGGSGSEEPGCGQPCRPLRHPLLAAPARCKQP